MHGIIAGDEVPKRGEFQQNLGRLRFRFPNLNDNVVMGMASRDTFKPERKAARGGALQQGTERKPQMRLTTKAPLQDIPEGEPLTARQTGEKKRLTKSQPAQEGDGIIDTLRDAASKVAGWVAPKSMSPKFKKWLDKYQDYVITGIQVCRKPIIGIIESVLRKISKPVPYDKLYHLYMILTVTKDGKSEKFRIERNQTLQVSPYLPSDDTQKEVPTLEDGTQISGDWCARPRVPPDMHLKVAFDKFQAVAQKRNPKLGPWRYAALPDGDTPSNNCQDFIVDFLRGIGSLTAGLKSNIMQDVAGLVPGWAQKIAQTITDAAGAATKTITGGQKGGCDCQKLELLA